MRVKVSIVQREVAVIDIGNLPVGLVRELLVKNEGSFDGNWTLSDVKGANPTFTTDLVEVEEIR